MQNRLKLAASRVTWLAATGVNLGLALGSLGLWGIAYAQRLAWRADFTPFYTGWSLVVSGRGQDLYDFAVQAVTQQRILAGRYLAGGLLPFNYPPHVALLFAPLGLLSLDQAYILWSALQVGLLVWLCRMLWKHLEAAGVSHRTRTLVVSAAIALPAVGATLLLGAFSTFLLLCLLGFARALRRGDDCQAALWVVLLTVKPQVAVVPALVLVATRRWRAVGIGAVCGLVILAGTTLASGWHVWPDFAVALSRTFRADESLGVAPSAMHNLRGILVSLLGAGSMELVNTISLFAFLVSLLLVVGLWSSNLGPDLDFDLRMSATLLLGLLFSLHVNPQDEVLLVAPALYSWHHLRRGGRGGRLFGALAVGCPLVFWVAERGLEAPWARRIPSLVMVLLGVWMVHACFARDGRGSELAPNSPSMCKENQ